MGSKPPFGYVKSEENKHLLVIDPSAAKIVERLFREFAGGESARSIAVGLNMESIETPAVYYFRQTGKRSTRGDGCQQWGSSTIMQLLKNQVYIGNMVQCKRKVSSFKTKKRLVTCSDDWVIVEHTHEPIIDEVTWSDVQRRLSTLRQAKCNSIVRTVSAEGGHVFSGIIRCADCGAAMAFNQKVRKNGQVKRIYRCSRYANNGAKVCTMHTFDADVLEAVILTDIQHHAEAAIHNESSLLDRLLTFTGTMQHNENAAREKELRETTNRITFIESASKKLFEEKVAGNVPDSLFRKMLADYECELTQMEEKAADLRQHLQESSNGKADVQRWLNLVKECLTIDKLDRATAFQLIDHVAIHEEHGENGIPIHDVRIKYNFVGCFS